MAAWDVRLVPNSVKAVLTCRVIGPAALMLYPEPVEIEPPVLVIVTLPAVMPVAELFPNTGVNAISLFAAITTEPPNVEIGFETVT